MKIFPSRSRLQNNAARTLSGKDGFFPGSRLLFLSRFPVFPNLQPNGTPGFHKILPMSEFCSFSMGNASVKTYRTLANKAVPAILCHNI